MIENVKLRQIIAKNNFPGIFQQKENFSENLTSSCHGNTFVGVMSKSTNLAKINLPGHMTIPTKFDKLKRGPFKLHPTINSFRIS